MSSHTPEKTGLSYRDAGVDIDAGDALVERIKPAVARTRRPEVLTGLGGFGALFALDLQRWRESGCAQGLGDRFGAGLAEAQPAPPQTARRRTKR